jgi:hypothetical protein
LLGVPVIVATINLGREWRVIEEELYDLINECAVAADAPA